MFAAPAHADPDTDFANELHTYGIYGQKDYNAWIGKITCKRLYNGVDKDAYARPQFIHLTSAEGQPPPSRRGSSSVHHCVPIAPIKCQCSDAAAAPQ